MSPGLSPYRPSPITMVAVPCPYCSPRPTTSPVPILDVPSPVPTLAVPYPSSGHTVSLCSPGPIASPVPTPPGPTLAMLSPCSDCSPSPALSPSPSPSPPSAPHPHSSCAHLPRSARWRGRGHTCSRVSPRSAVSRRAWPVGGGAQGAARTAPPPTGGMGSVPPSRLSPPPPGCHPHLAVTPQPHDGLIGWGEVGGVQRHGAVHGAVVGDAAEGRVENEVLGGGGGGGSC